MKVYLVKKNYMHEDTIVHSIWASLEDAAARCAWLDEEDSECNTWIDEMEVQ